MPTISLVKRGMVINMNKRGDSQRKIARDLKISRHGIQNILKKEKIGQTIKNMTKQCVPSKLSNREKRKIVIMSKKDHFLTANQIRYACDLAEKVSVATVKRVLCSSKLFGRVATKKPSLTKKQIGSRLKWCKEKELWNETDWSRVIFSDESKIELIPKRRQYVRRGPNENLLATNISKTKKFSPSIMIWGGIRSDGKRFIVKLNGTVNSLTYQNVLDVALPVLYSSRYLLQQDGATCHSSRSTSDYMTRNQTRLLQGWPPQSADLSPIENLWDYLKDKVLLRKPETVDELWKFTEEEFYLIPNIYIKNLYASIPRRINAVIKAKGGNTKY